MDIFTRFNRKAIQDRQVDTLIGISKGLIADNTINTMEAEFLMNWLIQNQQTSNPVIVNLLEKIGVMLQDGILDNEESKELLSLLRRITGESSTLGELTKTTTLPINRPQPAITFPGMTFLFTGTCAFGTRAQCQAAVETLGGLNAGSVNKSLNYLVLGTYVTDSWAHETFGRKIERAMEYRDNGVPLVIVTEEHWVGEAGLA